MREFRLRDRVGCELNFRAWDQITSNAKTSATAGTSSEQDRKQSAVCIVHGISEHAGRYQYVAEYFQRRGFLVFTFDHQGHGKSSGKRGDSAGLDSMLDDVDLLLDEARKSGAGSLFLYGHSMGGNLVLNHLLRRQPQLAGAIVTGPWIRLVKPPSKVLVLLGRLVRPFWPSMTLPNHIEVTDLSSDPLVIEAVKNDPLVHRRISIRMALELIDAAKFLNQFHGRIRCPLLLMHGGDDQITCPLGTKHFAGQVNGDVTMRLWEGLKHEIHQEPVKDLVLGFAADWMSHHDC